MKNSSLSKAYVSTGAFGRQPLTDIIQVASKAGISNIELSSDAVYTDQMWKEVPVSRQTLGMRYLIHNYFPTPAVPFVLNLASNEKEVLQRSLEHCRLAIRLCAEVGAPFYSVHSGFCFHAGPAHLGQKQTELKRIPMQEAENIFIDAIGSLADAAAASGVGLAIENNVLAPFNLVNGENGMYLAITDTDILRILKKAGRSNLKLLLDTGHLHVSSKSLGFDAVQFIRNVADHILAVHLSDNDGTRDNNQPIHADSWYWKPLLSQLRHEIHWVLEVYKITPEVITQQLAIIDGRLAEAAAA